MTSAIGEAVAFLMGKDMLIAAIAAGAVVGCSGRDEGVAPTFIGRPARTVDEVVELANEHGRAAPDVGHMSAIEDAAMHAVWRRCSEGSLRAGWIEGAKISAMYHFAEDPRSAESVTVAVELADAKRWARGYSQLLYVVEFDGTSPMTIRGMLATAAELCDLKDDGVAYPLSR